MRDDSLDALRGLETLGRVLVGQIKVMHGRETNQTVMLRKGQGDIFSLDELDVRVEAIANLELFQAFRRRRLVSLERV